MNTIRKCELRPRAASFFLNGKSSCSASLFLLSLHVRGIDITSSLITILRLGNWERFEI